MNRTAGIDDPQITLDRRRIIRQKSFLRKIYDEWYRKIADAIPPGEGHVLEIGSGAGFLREYLPSLLTSEIFFIPSVSVVLDARHMPVRRDALGGIVMTDVLHHIPDVRSFFNDAARCVRPGGVIAMIEPWHTPWSKLIYQNLHHEPFLPGAEHWEFPACGPLSSANGALPWIVFRRDRSQFESEFPAWRVERIEPTMPFRYLASGGFSRLTPQPGFLFPVWTGLERLLNPWMGTFAMFAFILLRRTDAAIQT